MWVLGCVNLPLAARGSQEAGFTQPRAHLTAQLCVHWLPCVYAVAVDLRGAPGLSVDVVDEGAGGVGAGHAGVVGAREGERALPHGVVSPHSYALTFWSIGGTVMSKVTQYG